MVSKKKVDEFFENFIESARTPQQQKEIDEIFEAMDKKPTRVERKRDKRFLAKFEDQDE